jgi:hypothetical protein
MATGGATVKQQANDTRRGGSPSTFPEAETAEELNVSLRTLRKWRQLRVGPPYAKVGRQVHYSDEGRTAWLKANEVQPITHREVRPAAQAVVA